MAVVVEKKKRKIKRPAINPVHIPSRKPKSWKRPGEVKQGVRGEPDRTPPPPFFPDI